MESIQIRSLLLCDLLTTTTLLIQSVSSFAFTTIFCSINSSVFFIISAFIATGIFCGTCCTGRVPLSTSRCSSPGRQPDISKTSPYSSNIFLFESRSQFFFLLVIFMSRISSFTWSLFMFRVTKFSGRPTKADIRG